MTTQDRSAEAAQAAYMAAMAAQYATSKHEAEAYYAEAQYQADLALGGRYAKDAALQAQIAAHAAREFGSGV